MCGLAGFSGFDNNIDLATKANKIQRHRGPDAQAVWHDDFFAFAHQRLSIIDLSDSANQPFVKEGLVIVFNGEIYNYQVLQKMLMESHDVEFVSNSDTEVILEMYRHYGISCVDYLVGMFVFGVYDTKKKELIVVRDHFGIKPLFYTLTKSGFGFASELKSLIGLPGFDKEINKRSLVSCLNYSWVSGDETMFVGCHKLPPGHYLLFNKESKVRIAKYWEIQSQAIDASLTEKEYISKVSEVVKLSVDRHMIADVPVSCFLSGGLDSSLIVSHASRTNKQLSTYTISTSERDKSIEQMPDDSKYARMIAEQFHTNHEEIHIAPDIMKQLPEIVRTLDEPIGDPAAINTYLICQAARAKGVKVLLSGMGADEIFFGYRRQKATYLALRFNRLPKYIKKAISRVVDILPVKALGSGNRVIRWAKRFMTFSTLPLAAAYMRSYSYYDRTQLRQLLKDDFWPAVDEIRQEHDAIFNSSYSNDPINQMCYTDLKMFMIGLNLTYTDRASMAASVEVRVPFIDKDVVNTAMNIPGDVKFKSGISKYVLKKAAEERLPREIIYRAKAAFGAPIRSWIMNDLRDMVDDLLSETNIEKRGMLNFKFVKRLIEDDRKGISDNAYQIYQFLTLELWCREYLDKPNI